MKVSIGVSNRHVHLTEEDFIALFGDKEINKVKDLVQTGQYASDCFVTIKTPKNSINRVRILGPFRSYTQVEISKTDSYFLGINPPIRDSGDLVGSETVTIIGECGEITKPCCIIATRHIHINPVERVQRGLLKDKYSVKIGNDKKSIIEDVHIKETIDGVFEMHIDTDDANANFVKSFDEAEIIL